MLNTIFQKLNAVVLGEAYFQSCILTSHKRPMGHIAHLRNLNTFEQRYDQIYHRIGQVVQEKIFKFHECTCAIFFTQGCFLPSLVEVSPVVLKKIFKFWLFCNLPLERCVAFHWIKLYTFSQECFVLSLFEIDPMVLVKAVFKFCQCIFTIS